MNVENSLQGQKGIALKIKIGYSLNGTPVSKYLIILRRKEEKKNNNKKYNLNNNKYKEYY